MNRVALRCFLVLALVTLISSCSSRLSRGKAEELIVKHYQLPISIVQYIPVGTRQAPCVHTLDEFLADQTRERPQFKVFLDRGLTTITNVRPYAHGQYEWGFFGCEKYGILFDHSLTSAGQKLVIAQQQASSNQVSVKICEQHFGKVTGIAFSEGEKMAKVEFTTRYANHTPFMLPWKARDFDISVDHPSSISMRLYDDGWRIEK